MNKTLTSRPDDVFRYAHELTWDEFLEIRSRKITVIDWKGCNVYSPFQKTDDKEVWRLYNAAVNNAMFIGKISVREEVIRGCNDKVVPMISDGEPAPVAPPVETVDFMGSCGLTIGDVTIADVNLKIVCQGFPEYKPDEDESDNLSFM
jgi:hypothetical protein